MTLEELVAEAATAGKAVLYGNAESGDVLAVNLLTACRAMTAVAEDLTVIGISRPAGTHEVVLERADADSDGGYLRVDTGVTGLLRYWVDAMSGNDPQDAVQRLCPVRGCGRFRLGSRPLTRVCAAHLDIPTTWMFITGDDISGEDRKAARRERLDVLTQEVVDLEQCARGERNVLEGLRMEAP